MNIIVLGGSPKGKVSVTMQYVEYMRQYLKEHTFTVIQVAAPIKHLEKNRESFQQIMKQVKEADAVLWAFPLYYCLVCSQYKRFIELIFERGAESAFARKYAASLSTSIHFFDHTAHEYIRSISEDLDMNYVGFYSAKMNDIFKSKGRTGLRVFSDSIVDAVKSGVQSPRYSLPLPHSAFVYKSQNQGAANLHTAKKITIVTDTEEGNTGRMIKRFKDCFSTDVEVVNLSKISIKGGCLGCLKCSTDNTCAYTGKDDFIDMFNNSVKTADILVFAGEIRDRYLSSTWKLFFDRSFFNTHQMVLGGKQVGIFISGPLRYIPNLTQILRAYFEMQSSNLVDIITDESADSVRIDSLLGGLALRLTNYAEAEYHQPATFLGVGGMKVFRDDIWAELKYVFRADYKYYKKHRLFDFPQKHRIRNLLFNLVYVITGIPFIRRRMVQKMRQYLIMPFKRVLAQKA
ncbi:MAG: NAD(P)H-dependent oxidoreductase [Spirochaetia bacterium]